MAAAYEKFALNTPKSARFLLPEKREIYDPPRYRFIIQSFEQTVHYAALSYVWGDPSKCGTILLEGVPFKITQNLLAALERVEATLDSDAEMRKCRPILLWADQICINQANYEERASQVAMMGILYSGARYVLACIGDSTAAYAVASLVDEVASQIDRDVVRHKELNNIPYLDPDQVSAYGKFNWSAFRDMMLLPYFSRAWIIQEMGLSQCGIVLLGNCHFSLDRLMLVLAWLSVAGSRIRQIYQISGWTTHQIWLSFDATRRDTTGLFTPFNFLDLLSHVSYRCASTDPRDYIFALLGHPSSQSIDHGSQSFVTNPDYVSSVKNVYLRFAIAWLEYSAEPYLFSCVSHLTLPGNSEKGQSLTPRHQLDLPSWCPHWDYNPLGGNRLDVERAPKRWYAASRASPFVFRIVQQEQLELKGILHDQVTQTFPKLNELIITIDEGNMLNETLFTPHELLTALKLCYVFGKFLQAESQRSLAPGRDAEDTIFTLASTAIAGVWGAEDTSYDKPAHIANFKAMLKEVSKLHKSVLEDDVAIALGKLESCCEQLKPNGLPGQPVSFLQKAMNDMIDRRKFMTYNGCVGFGPAIISPGDMCCVISGANVPYLLRTINDASYLLVGECYVQSVMHGEAVPCKVGQAAVWRDIRLQ